MLCARRKLKVFWAIVGLDAVYVVNDLVRQQLSIQYSLHYGAMQVAAPACGHEKIPMPGCADAAFPMPVVFATSQIAGIHRTKCSNFILSASSFAARNALNDSSMLRTSTTSNPFSFVRAPSLAKRMQIARGMLTPYISSNALT